MVLDAIGISLGSLADARIAGEVVVHVHQSFDGRHVEQLLVEGEQATSVWLRFATGVVNVKQAKRNGALTEAELP